MNWQRLKATFVGFLGVFLILGLILNAVGLESLLLELSSANSRILLLVALSTLGWLATWGIGLRKILGVLDSKPSYAKSFFIINGAMFFNNVTPFGQAGGEPVTALLISKVAKTNYERSLATISTMDSLNFLPSVSLAIVGTGYYATQATFEFGAYLLIPVVVILVLILASVGYIAWKKRDVLERVVARGVTSVVNSVLRLVPKATLLDESTVRSRIENFTNSIETIMTDRKSIALALTAATLGWVFQMIALWLSFLALEVSIPLSIALFVVPLGATAGVTPLPGGAGSIEAVLIGVLSSLLVPVVSGGTIAAAVLIYRGAVYIIPVAIGGIFASIVGVSSIQNTT